jgi:protein-arginine kinase
MRAQDSVKAESGKDFLLSEKYGFLHSCPTNLGTGTMQAYLFLILNFLVISMRSAEIRFRILAWPSRLKLNLFKLPDLKNFRFCLQRQIP